MSTLLEALRELKEDNSTELIDEELVCGKLIEDKEYDLTDDDDFEDVYDYVCDTTVEDSVFFDDIKVTMTHLVSRGFYAYPNGDPGEPDEYDDYEAEVEWEEEDVIDYFRDEIADTLSTVWEKLFNSNKATGKQIMEADWSEINDMIEPAVRSSAEEHAQAAADEGEFDRDTYDYDDWDD